MVYVPGIKKAGVGITLLDISFAGMRMQDRKMDFLVGYRDGASGIR
jgi:hypothetical protein